MRLISDDDFNDWMNVLGAVFLTTLTFVAVFLGLRLMFFLTFGI